MRTPLFRPISALLSALALSACALPAAFSPSAPPVARLQAQSSAPSIIRLSWRNSAELAELAGSGLDLFGESHRLFSLLIVYAEPIPSREDLKLS